MPNTSFFSLSEMKQPVNQWLCIAFLGVLCFWVVLFYFTEKSVDIGENWGFVQSESSYSSK